MEALIFPQAGLEDETLAEVQRIYIVACGSAYHVGVVGKYVIEGLAKIPVEVDLASEFRYRNPILAEKSLSDRGFSVRGDCRQPGSPSSGKGERSSCDRDR